MGFWILLAFLVVQRLTELVIARRNERWMKARGGFEAGAAHYKWIVMVHVLFFISLTIEVQGFGAHPAFWWPIPFAVFVAAQLLRFWALFSLGHYWNTRIIVLPGAKVVAKGPYRFMRHPNYVIVATEILTIPLIFQAYATAVVFSVLNAFVLLFVRIPEEERALSRATNYQESTGKRPRFFP
ncbi:MAG TPA: isoprenylcysteine carboxyl methyltransferase family protein [Bacillales bacterium]|nr:isoprenylcysteine carboxyl methyltransferase family protein [Bacillales bacterium]